VLPDPGDLHSLVLRTDFSSDSTWAELRSAIAAPQGEFRAMVTFVDDRRYERLTIETLLQMTRTDPNRTFIFVADSEAMARSDHAILVVDLRGDPGRTFRVVPPAMWSVQNNLYLANMDWEEFAESAGADGVFRGFPE
jgi:hypothetical protein